MILMQLKIRDFEIIVSNNNNKYLANVSIDKYVYIYESENFKDVNKHIKKLFKRGLPYNYSIKKGFEIFSFSLKQYNYACDLELKKLMLKNICKDIDEFKNETGIKVNIYFNDDNLIYKLKLDDFNYILSGSELYP